MVDGFRTGPPDHVARIDFRIIRVKPGKPIEFWSVSDEPICIATHWTGRRSIKCPEVDCGYCHDLVEQRWRGYLWGVSCKGEELAIVEYTGGVGKQIEEFWKERGSLLGQLMRLTRNGKANNAPLECTFGKPSRSERDLPVPPVLKTILDRIYDFKQRRDIEPASDQEIENELPNIATGTLPDQRKSG